MKLFLKNKLVVPDGVLVRDLAGESVLLNLNSESYFGLDEVGTHMWTVLTTSPSIDAAFDTLLIEYEVDPVQLRDDLRSFIEKLVDLGLLDVQAD